MWKDIFAKLTVPFLLTLCILLGYELVLYSGIDNSWFGIHPMDVSRIYGIITVPLVHGNASHLFNNLMAFIGLTVLLYLVYYRIANIVMLILWVFTGVLMFLFARPEYYHIGASGVVYALIFFLITAGFITRTRVPVVISIVVAFYYGGSIWGIFPLDKNVSWDGHLSGLIVGLITALVLKKQIGMLFPLEKMPDWYYENEPGNDEYGVFDNSPEKEESDS